MATQHMTKLPVRFDRPFQIWHYAVSHGQLLLRSVKGDTYKTRVDVLFKNVDLIQLPGSFSGLRISEMTKDEFQPLNLSIGEGSEIGNRYFRLEGDGWTGLVVAGAVFWVEEDAEHNEQSKLFDAPCSPRLA